MSPVILKELFNTPSYSCAMVIDRITKGEVNRIPLFLFVEIEDGIKFCTDNKIVYTIES